MTSRFSSTTSSTQPEHLCSGCVGLCALRAMRPIRLLSGLCARISRTNGTLLLSNFLAFGEGIHGVPFLSLPYPRSPLLRIC